MIRSLVRRPAFAIGMALTLTLVIGLSTAIFSTVYGLILRPLPYRDPGRLVTIMESNRAIGADHLPVTEGAFPIIARDSRSFESAAACVRHAIIPNALFASRLWGTDETLDEQACTSQLFPTLGVVPLLGRTFAADEDVWKDGRAEVAVLSYAFWRAHYGGRADVLGQTLSVNSFGNKEDFAIIGVMPQGFEFPHPFSSKKPDVWTNLALYPMFSSGTNLDVIARLKPGISLDHARAELAVMGGRMRADYPKDYKDEYLSVSTLQSELIRDEHTIVWSLLAALGAVLVGGCTNIACLLLMHAAARKKEMAVRAALGAGRVALIRQTLWETFLLVVAGGAMGLVLATNGLRLLVALLPPSLYIPRLDAVPLDPRVLAVSTGVSVLTAVLFGVVPALRLAKPDLVADLKPSTQAIPGGGVLARARGLLLISEISVAVVLVTGTMLLTQSVRRFLAAGEPFQPERLISMDVWFTNAFVDRTTNLDTVEARLYAQFRDRVLAMPGVHAVAFVDHWPLFSLHENPNSFKAIGGEGAISKAFQPAEQHMVDGAYLGIASPTHVRGRWFSEADGPSAVPVAVINTAMARRYFADRDPIGARIEPSFRRTDQRQVYTVVGVIDELKRFGSGLDADPAVFLSVAQCPFYGSVVIRTGGTPAALIEPLREAALAIAPGDMLVANLRTGEDVMSESSARARFTGLLLSGFSGLALVLALVGTYTLVSYDTARRRREMGIRLALGATPGRIQRMVVVGAGYQVGVGIVVGIAAAYTFARSLSALLYGIAPADASSFVVATLAITAVAILACYLPARRAARTDPLEAVRYD